MANRNVKNENEALTNFLRSAFTKNDDFFIQNADDRIGKKYAIAKKTERGGIDVKTNFMTYNEMNCFFMGMLTIKENRIKF
jgi:hypothetical protein